MLFFLRTKPEEYREKGEKITVQKEQKITNEMIFFLRNVKEKKEEKGKTKNNRDQRQRFFLTKLKELSTTNLEKSFPLKNIQILSIQNIENLSSSGLFFLSFLFVLSNHILKLWFSF